MTKLKPKTRTPANHPVTVTVLPVVRCAECGHPMAHQPGPGSAQEVLTAHYNKEHLTELAEPSR